MGFANGIVHRWAAAELVLRRWLTVSDKLCGQGWAAEEEEVYVCR